MKKPLTIVLAAAAFFAADAMALADNGLTYYAATNPRIIQIPQRGEEMRDINASVRRVVPRDVDDEVAAPARPQRAVKTDLRPQPRLPLKQQVREEARAPVKQVAAKEPVRRKPLNNALPEAQTLPEPEPTGPRRALLSAPPPPPSSPLFESNTPRFGQPMPSAPEPLTTFTPPQAPPAPVVSNEPDTAPEPVVTAHAPADDDDDHLPPPGDPRLAPPEPRR